MSVVLQWIVIYSRCLCVLCAVCCVLVVSLTSFTLFAQGDAGASSLSEVQPPSVEEKEVVKQLTLDSFEDMKSRVINLISGAKSRIRLATNLLTDGDVVSALFLARFRKVDVVILLGREKINHFMSRVDFLKNNKILVYFKPRYFPLTDATIVMIDNEINLGFSSNLSPFIGVSKYIMKSLSKSDVTVMEQRFDLAIKSNIPIPSKSKPVVGKARYNNNGEPIYNFKQNDVTYKEVDAVYNYDKAPKHLKVPQGMVTRLPAQTVLQGREDETRRQSRVSTEVDEKSVIIK